MKKVKKWMLGILAATTVVAAGCGNHTDMVSVAVIKGVDSTEKISEATEAETTEPIRIELATEAVKETTEPETTAPAEPEISSTDKLLIEIRDLLKKDEKHY